MIGGFPDRSPLAERGRRVGIVQSKRAKGGLVTGFTGQEKAPARPSRSTPAMNATPTVRKIPLNQLVLSPTNVRKVPPRAAEDAELKASIRSRGLKQNLVVHRAAGDSDIHEVTAGGRRLKALQALAAEGVIAADYKVPCLVEAAGDALETSLMENTIRAAMHPADEFVAMAALIDAGSTVEAAAVRFGVPEQRVKQRLRLGKLAPELLDAYRDGSVSLDIIMAFTLGADHAAQLAVWHQVKDQHYLSAHSVRRLLTDSAVPLDSDLGAFVGTAAYEDAGGKVTRDLFSSEDEGFMDDAALVRRLAIEKLEAKAAELRGQWAWAKPVLDLDYGFRRQFGCVEPLPAEFPPEIAAELQVIEERLVQIEELAEDELPDEVMTEAAPARGTPRPADRNDRGPRRLRAGRSRDRRVHRHHRRRRRIRNLSRSRRPFHAARGRRCCRSRQRRR